uniref:RXYLT1 C-terminal domain-containing protein n=1 Tax=Eutreptiella gymnastica TaxID=73025 RepID=A0A7S1IGV8_9EUGL|mmetsp:Transcript_17696/g.31395  ORF Transcript_17696/g.31395 Transcript_17696/m.31395 type:complete len:420 (+) Transcript_17696:42-1301(+)
MNPKRFYALVGLLALVSGTLWIVFWPTRAAVSPAAQRASSDRIRELEAANAQLREEVARLTQQTKVQAPAAAGGGATCSIPLPTYHYQDSRPLHLVFLTNPIPFQYGGQISEALWIRDTVLSKLQRPVLTHIIPEKEKHDTFFNDSLVVCLFLKRTMYFERARAAGATNVGLYWMGDEKYEHDRSFIPMADYVFRNYYHSELIAEHPNLHWLPNGMKSGLGHASGIPSTLPLASQRSLLCNFLGSLRSHRKDMLEHLKSHDIHCAVFVNSWEDKSTKHPILYRFTYLEHSKFTLCPFGNNPETMRHYEALEHGSIPIVFHYKDPKLDVLKAFGPNHPLPVFKSFHELPEFFRRFENDAAALDELQAKILTWWIARKDELMTQARNVIEASFAKKYGHATEAAPPMPPCSPVLGNAMPTS